MTTNVATGAEDAWRAADLASGRLGPAGQWRQEIARHVAAASGGLFAAVFTCPPGRPLEAQFDVFPEEAEPLVRAVCRRFLPRVERGKDASYKQPPGPAVFAPLEAAADQRLAKRLRKEVYEPVGVEGVVVAPFTRQGVPWWMGWIVIASSEDSHTLLHQAGPRLARVASIAVRTLEQARLLAEAIGAPVAQAPPPGLSLLSKREREVVDQAVSGSTDAQIAHALGISEQTVGSHLKRIYQKVGIHSRVELAARFGALSSQERP